MADDSADDLFFLSCAFEKSGLNLSLFSVRDGAEAIEFLKRHPFPDLLLLDLKMPKVDGFEVLKWIQTNPELRDLPVVVLSSSDLDEDKQRAKELGAKAYFVKTADLESMLDMIAVLYVRFLKKADTIIVDNPPQGF